MCVELLYLAFRENAREGAGEKFSRPGKNTIGSGKTDSIVGNLASEGKFPLFFGGNLWYNTPIAKGFVTLPLCSVCVLENSEKRRVAVMEHRSSGGRRVDHSAVPEHRRSTPPKKKKKRRR